MGELLKALYENRINAEPVIEKRDKSYRQACDAAYGLLEELSGRLMPEDRELFIRWKPLIQRMKIMRISHMVSGWVLRSCLRY